MASATQHSTSSHRTTTYLSPLDQYMPRIYVTIYLVFHTPDPSAAIRSLQMGVEALGDRLPFLRGYITTPSSEPVPVGRDSGDHRGRMAITWSPADDAPLSLHRIDDSVTKPAPTFRQLHDEGAPLHYFANTFPLLLQARIAANPPPASIVNEGWGATPAFAASYTVLDEGLVVGVAAHHGLVDGTGVAELVRVWAACTANLAGSDSGSQDIFFPDPNEPSLRSDLLRSALPSFSSSPSSSAETKPLPETLLSSSREFTLRSSLPAQPQAVDTAAPGGKTTLFTFSVPKLDAARRALSSMSLSPGNKMKKETDTALNLDPASLSANNLLCAIMWTCVARARASRRGGDGTLGLGRSKMGFAINGRRSLGLESRKTGAKGNGDHDKRASSSRVKPGSGSPYLGNVNLYGLPEMDGQELVNIGGRCAFPTGKEDSDSNSDSDSGAFEALAPVVKAIYQAIKRVTPQHIADVVALVEAVEDVRDVQPNWVRSNGADLSVTSWANMDVYESDFGRGVGKAVYMRVPSFVSDGLLIVLPRKRGGAAEGASWIEVVAVLCREEIEFLERDGVWGSWLA